MKYRVINGFPSGDPMMSPHRVGDILNPAPNVAKVLLDRGVIEPIVDEPKQADIEMAAMQTADEASGHRELTKAKRKVRSKVL